MLVTDRLQLFIAQTFLERACVRIECRG